MSSRFLGVLWENYKICCFVFDESSVHHSQRDSEVHGVTKSTSERTFGNPCKDEFGIFTDIQNVIKLIGNPERPVGINEEKMITLFMDNHCH